MSDRPDILFIITDHHAWHGHFTDGQGNYGGGIAPVGLPVWERFCEQGVRFDRTWTVSPLCSPARSSMLSGLRPTHHRLRGNNHMQGLDLDPQTRFFSHYLQTAGYRNDYYGKWHCGHDLLPHDFGFVGWSLPDYGQIYLSEVYRSYCAERGLGVGTAHVEMCIDKPELAGHDHPQDHESPFYFMNCSGVLRGPRAGHEADFVAQMCVDAMRRNRSDARLSAMVASFWGPHHPFFPSEPFADTVDPQRIARHPSFDEDLAGKPLRYRRHRDERYRGGVRNLPNWEQWQPILARCYEQTLQTDAAVGKILEELEASGRAENTLVIWCADHGDALASHSGLWDKGFYTADAVMRVPFAMRWPARWHEGRVCREPISNLDCPATILEAAGCPIPEDWHSRSLLGVADGTEQRDLVFGEHDCCEQRMIIDGRWKYTLVASRGENGEEGDELYDREADPWELRNLADEPGHVGVRSHLRKRLLPHVADEPDGPGRTKLRARLQEA